MEKGHTRILIPLESRFSSMKSNRLKVFNYAVGMFGTSIPINSLKTCAAIYYVDQKGLTKARFRPHPFYLHLH